MPRLTQAQQIQQQQEEQALAFFEATLAPLPDPRRARVQIHGALRSDPLMGEPMAQADRAATAKKLDEHGKAWKSPQTRVAR